MILEGLQNFGGGWGLNTPNPSSARHWTQGSAIESIELYKRKEITWDRKHPMHFNKIRQQDAWEELGKEMNRPVDECVSANLSWTEMAFLKAVSFSETFSPIKLIKIQIHWETFWWNSYTTRWPTENSSLPANSNRCTLPCLCTAAFATTAALFSFSLKHSVYKCTKLLLAAKTSLRLL